MIIRRFGQFHPALADHWFDRKDLCVFYQNPYRPPFSGDWEKPGAERAAKLMLVYYVSP